MTPKLFTKYKNAYARRLMNLSLAYHDPKSLPKLSEENKEKSMTDEQMELEAMRLTKMFGGIIKE